ncbi:MAG: pyrroline-5-carboxylate reductase [Spirochaetales bacterium]|nr:pyrroline-5-carboxylate reductase [Spirochaetales bacterium]
MKKIAIIGAGNIGIAIAQGVVDSGLLPADCITLARRRIQLLDDLKDQGFRVENDNITAANHADIVVIAVEPQQLDGLLNEISDALNPEKQIVISIVTGVPISEMRHHLGDELRILRAMPNTAISVRESMTCIATDSSEDEDIAFAFSLFESVGSVLRISEEEMNAATALGACGIAFFLQAIRAASQGGIEIGFNASDALTIATQAAKGAAMLLRESESHPSQEIDKVTTPRGCTIAGLNRLEHEGFSSALIQGIKTSADKAAQLYPKAARKDTE